MSDQSSLDSTFCEIRTDWMALSLVHLDMFESSKNHATKMVMASAIMITANDLRNAGLPDRAEIVRKIAPMVPLANRRSLDFEKINPAKAEKT